MWVPTIGGHMGEHLSGAPLCGKPVKLGLRNNYLEENRFNRLEMSVWSPGFRNDPSGRVVPDSWDILAWHAQVQLPKQSRKIPHLYLNMPGKKTETADHQRAEAISAFRTKKTNLIFGFSMQLGQSLPATQTPRNILHVL